MKVSVLASLLLISPSIFGQAKLEKNQHYWESRKIPASVTRQFLRNDLQKAETTLLGIVEEHQAKKRMDVQEHFDCMLALVECAHRLQRQELYDIIRTLIVLRENHLTLQTTVNDEAFYSLLLLIESDSGEWTWGREQGELHVHDGRNLPELFDGYRKLSDYHLGDMSEVKTDLCEAVAGLNINDLTSLANLQFRWELAAFTHNFNDLDCVLAKYEEIKQKVEGDSYWKSMFQFLGIKSKLLYSQPDEESVENEIIEFQGVMQTELDSYFCLANTLIDGFKSTMINGFIPESYTHGDCDLNLAKWEWYFMHFWTVAIQFQQSWPERSLRAWDFVFPAMKKVHGPLEICGKVAFANSLVNNGKRAEAEEVLSNLDLAELESLPPNVAATTYLFLLTSATNGIARFSVEELLLEVSELTQDSDFPVIRSTNQFAEAALCFIQTNGNVDDCIYSKIDTSTTLLFTHKLQLVLLAADGDQNALRAIEKLTTFLDGEIGINEKKKVLQKIHAIYCHLEMDGEANAIKDEVIQLTNEFYPQQGSYGRLETIQLIFRPFYQWGFTQEMYERLVDYLQMLELHGFKYSLLHMEALHMASWAAGDLGHVEDELSFLQDYQELVLNFFGPKSPAYVQSICNAATSDYYDGQAAIDATKQCLSLLDNVPNSRENIAFYLENLGVCYANSNKHDSAFIAYTQAIQIGDEFLPQKLNETPLNGRSFLLKERAHLLTKSFQSAKKSHGQINYNQRARSLQMSLPSLSCSNVENLSGYREAKWAAVNARQLTKDERQKNCAKWKFPAECVNDSSLYQDYCELMAANLEGENYRNVSMENLNIEHALGQNKAIVDVIPYFQEDQYHYDVITVFNDGEIQSKALSTFSQEDINSLKGMWQSWVENGTLNQSFIQTVSDFVLGEAFQLPERIEEIYFLFGGPLAFINPRVLMSPEGEFLSNSHKCVEIVGFQGIYGDWLADLSSIDKIQAFGGLNYGDTGLPNLPGSNREVDKIAEVGADSRLECEVVTGTLEKANFEEISSPDVLHLSMHGIFTEENNSNTISSGDPYGMLSNCELLYPNSNGHLESISGTELACVDLSCTTLSVLASCNSGAGEFSVYGQHDLARAFFMAGSKFVISSKWEVSDDAAQFFMSKFYDNLSRDDNLLSCFNSAIDMTAEHYPISDWGNWTLQMK